MKLTDANQAVARVAYLMSDTIPTYPITPATPMIDWATEWSLNNEPNLEGMVPTQSNWQSEGGVAGALHGSIQCGGLGTTFTSSQGLLLMLPTMYRMAGSLLPNVIHVATRTIAKQGLSIFSDHTDIMAVRDSGYALLGSSTVQEAQDLACIAHIATHKSSIPFLHFFDGFKTSHSIENINELTHEQLETLWPKKEILTHRNQGLSPEKPQAIGVAQSGTEFFETRKTHAEYYKKLPTQLEQSMLDFEMITGRRYRLFDYYGHPEATHVFMVMGSAAGPAQEAVAKLNDNGYKTGVIIIRLFKPFSLEHFIKALPLTCTHLYTLEAGMDNTLQGGPIFQEASSNVLVAYHSHQLLELPMVNSICYGLSGYPLTSDMLLSIFNRLNDEKTVSPLFLDSMVSETEDPFSPISDTLFIHNKDREFDIRSVMDNLQKDGNEHVQGNTYVTYLKNEPFKKVQLRWSQEPILQNHLVKYSKTIIAHWESIPWLGTELSMLKEGGTLYIAGPNEKKTKSLKELHNLIQLLTHKQCELIWITVSASLPNAVLKEAFQFVYHRYLGNHSDELPKLSKENGNEQELMEDNTPYFIPDWNSEKCTQCGLCSVVCPTGALEAKAFNSSFGAIAPLDFPLVAANESLGLKEDGLFSIQVNTSQCDGCLNCVTSCPENALKETDLPDKTRTKHWKFFSKIPQVSTSVLEKTKLSQLQLLPAYYKYPISNKGAAISVYLKLLSQLFGDSLVMANATGSSSIIAGTAGYSPWQKNEEGRGPVWSNSLFENNAEFGLGMRYQYDQERARVKNWLKTNKPDWFRIWEEENMDQKSVEEQRMLLSEWKSLCGAKSPIVNNLNSLLNKSVWLVGGDGWAYDIGYGGLDHVLASGANVNILVLDNELYENTGGQFSKASPMAANGFRSKKDLGRIAMTYDHVYVASVSYGADPEQLAKALLEAESYDGPSLVLAYCHSESHGINMREPQKYHQALVDSGSWLLYRNDPRLKQSLQLDSTKPSMLVEDYLKMEKRFRKISNPMSAYYSPKMIEALQQRVNKRYAFFVNQVEKPKLQEAEFMQL